MVLVLRRVRRRWLSHVGALFVIMAFIFHGLTEVAQLLFPGMNPYRVNVAQEDIDSWILVVSVAILLFSIVYSLRLRQLSRRTVQPLSNRTPSLDWRLILALTLPGYVAILSGQKPGDLGYWVVGLTSQFLIFGISLTAISFLVKRASSVLIMPVIIIQSLTIALIGSRLLVVVLIIILLSVLLRYGINIRFRDLLFALLMTSCVVVLISVARFSVGRETLSGTTSDRLGGLVSGVQALGNQRVSSLNLAEDFVYRFDGNSFNAMVYNRLLSDRSTTGLAPFWNNFVLAVPSFLNPTKLDLDETVRSEKTFLTLHYDLPQGFDYIPTTLGVIFSYYGTIGLWISLSVLGWFLSTIDHWLQTSRTLLSLLVGIGLTYCVVFIEQGITVYFLTFRGIFTLFLFLAPLSLIARFFARSLGPRRVMSIKRASF